jgi:hypothetical protein
MVKQIQTKDQTQGINLRGYKSLSRQYYENITLFHS